MFFLLKVLQRITFPLRGARRGFEVHATEPPSAQPDAAGWAGTVGMGVGLERFHSVTHS
jgi:hypothetical protein